MNNIGISIKSFYIWYKYVTAQFIFKFFTHEKYYEKPNTHNRIAFIGNN